MHDVSCMCTDCRALSDVAIAINDCHMIAMNEWKASDLAVTSFCGYVSSRNAAFTLICGLYIDFRIKKTQHFYDRSTMRSWEKCIVHYYYRCFRISTDFRSCMMRATVSHDCTQLQTVLNTSLSDFDAAVSVYCPAGKCEGWWIRIKHRVLQKINVLHGYKNDAA